MEAACHALVDAGKVRRGSLETDDWERFLDASDYLRKAHIHIDEHPNLDSTGARRLCDVV